jgi:hypothetical protein
VHKYGYKYPTYSLPEIRQNQTLGWLSSMPEPWLMMIAWPAAHGNFIPTPWAKDTMSKYNAPITPEYNALEGYMKQKHWLLRQLGPLSKETATKVDKIYH